MRVSEEVLDVLANRLTYMRIANGDPNNSVQIQGQLDRKLYVATNKALEACGFAWSRHAQRHVLAGDSDPGELIALILSTGEVTTAADLGFFATPEPLAKQLVAMAELKPGMCVLEPSAGEGAIVEVLLAAGVTVYAIERDARRRRTLLERFVRPTIAAERFVVPYPGFGTPTFGSNGIDFMDYEAEESFDAVVMNPPFLRCGKGDHIDHVYHALECVKPGGVVVSVMPSGITFRKDKRHTTFRERMQKFGTIEPLPEGSFKASGTNVNTCVVKVRR